MEISEIDQLKERLSRTNAQVLKLRDHIQFIAEVASEELDFAKVGTGAEVALRHISRRAETALADQKVSDKLTTFRSNVSKIVNIKQAARAYFKWLGSDQIPDDPQIVQSAKLCGMHIRTLERMQSPSNIVLASALEALTQLEVLLAKFRRKL